MKTNIAKYSILLVLSTLMMISAGQEYLLPEGNLWLKGYVEDVSGEILTYHSPHPDATTSLLVRSLNSNQYIEWELEAIPEEFNNEMATFVWMYGIDVNENSFEYKFYLNDNYLFSFYNPQDTLNKSFEIDGKRGTKITFQPTLVDKYGDFMGYAFFSVPVSELRKNEPNHVKIVGESKNNQAWYMTFRYGLDSKVTANQQPALLRGSKGGEYLVRFDIHHFGDPVVARLIIDGKEYHENIDLGLNMVNINIPAEENPFYITAKVKIGEDIVFSDTVGLKPVEQMDLYLIHHSHNDIGYTHIQSEVEQMQHQYLEVAVALAKQSNDYPEGSRFKWNTEVLWAVDSYFEKASEDKKQELIKAIQDGWIALDGLYANELTALCRQEELVWLTEAGRRISRECNVPLESAMISDIPGYTWGLVTTMGESGIKYFSVGTNNGHRIGTIMEELSDRPFYWESIDGKHKILTWVHGRGYSWFHTGLGFEKLQNRLKEKPVFEYLNHLEQTGYPYDMVVVRYNIGSDNGPPDPYLAKHIKRWNEKFISPRVIISTVSESFGVFEDKYGEQTMVRRGDLTPYWEDGALSSASETAMCRETAEKLVQADILWAMNDIKLYPEDKFREAWKNVLLYDEHTWGSWNSISEPEIPFTIKQWERKKEFVITADSITNHILADSLLFGIKKQKDWEAFDVVNTQSWERSDIFYLTASQSNRGDKVADEKGNWLRTQRLSTGELAVFVEGVPPFGSKRLYIHAGEVEKISLNAKRELNIADENFRIQIDESTGEIISIIDRSTGRELVDNSKNTGFDQYLYVAGRDPSVVQKTGMNKFKIKEDGDLIKTIQIVAEAPGCKMLDKKISLIAPLHRIDVVNELRKENVYDPEGVHFAFPFNLSNSKIRIDVGFGCYIPEEQQIPGSNKNYYTPQRWVDISEDNYGVTWISRDAPVVELGEIATDATLYGWKEKQEPTSTIFSYVMNNYWETNYTASQEGRVIFRYSIIPHEAFDAAEAERNAMAFSQPLIVIPVNEETRFYQSLLSLSNNNVVVSIIKPAEDGKGRILRLFNASDKAESTKIRWKALSPDKIYLSNFYEDKLEETGSRFDLLPFEVITLYLE